MSHDLSPLEIKRHTLSHLMTMAIVEKYPNAGLGVGPWIEHGWYQDYDLPEPLSENDFEWIEKRMRELIKENIEFKKEIYPNDEAREMVKDDPYKKELVEELIAKGEKEISFYRSGNFLNLCAGPHVARSGEIKPDSFKILSVAGAYWRGDEKNKMLTRLYGVGFDTKVELDAYINMLEEARRRDHRKLGKELELFVYSDLVGKGLPLWTSRGATIRREIERFIVDEEIKRGYEHVYTPDIANIKLYETSGHYPYYKDSMYAPITIDDESYMLRPMTCPHHFQLYSSKQRSYRELPVRIAELAKLYRYEQSGELTGLIRVRSFCLADAHIVATREQAADEINNALDLIEYSAQVFGFKPNEDYWYQLSLGDRSDNKKYYKDDEAWEQAEDVLRSVLKTRSVKNTEALGEAAFYGPKIDIQMKNISGKEDTAFTVQYDFVMPKRFKLTYIDADNQEKEPIVIHRSSVGAIERIIAFLIERYAGALPLWMAPMHVVLLPVNDSHHEYCRSIADEMRASGIRVEIDESHETIGKKIRNSAHMKYPYSIVIGDKEISSKLLPARIFGVEEQVSLSKEDLMKKIIEKIKTYSTDYKF